MRIDVDIDTSGPFFDGRAVRALHDFVDEAPYEIAREGLGIYLSIYRPQVRQPTPYYEYLIEPEKLAEYGVAHLWDGGECVYGPWLEGTGSRNSPATRFPGYGSMKKTTPELQAVAGTIAERLFADRYERRMN
ncbi:hypothetical protein MXD62_19975 [Frankia sp. Mgl5]|uniref:hypothetical protein n=1 Tax=Frankia sp. Mgl5 TaxID=2933793 RepID=UPI00200F99FC|nr:hypothetical protein [Frankia sp. Mgl5]MCK9929430.1 hypothetical protein [Frankia sp. Mgl5]